MFITGLFSVIMEEKQLKGLELMNEQWNVLGNHNRFAYYSIFISIHLPANLMISFLL